MKYFLLFFLILIVNIAFSQKYDYQWIFGYSDDEANKFGITLLDFNNDDVDVSYYGGSSEYELEFGGSFINNFSGDLILHTNNCEVRDANWDVISDDELITPSGSAVSGCSGTSAVSYAALQSSIFLPELNDTTLTYLIHKDRDIDFDAQDLPSDSMWFSTIKEVDGEYKFKKRYRINDETMILENLTACPNRAKDKWWVLMPLLNSNVFTKYLIGNDTVIKYPNQTIGIELKTLELGIGQAQYSPDGSMLGINSEGYGVLLYDFDNETGELSNFRQIPYPNSKNVAQGLCFSPNNRFIYLTTAENVYQVDLEEDYEVFHIGYYRSFDGDGWPVGLGMIFSGPDCRLYVSPGSTTYYLHVILNPDEKGSKCKFIERAIETPANIAHDTPNLPQYRYLTGCDSSIVFPFDVSVVDKIEEYADIEIYPNPASQSITIVIKDQTEAEFEVINSMGKVIEVLYVNRDIEIDVSKYTPGIYFLKERTGVIATKKFSIVR